MKLKKNPSDKAKTYAESILGTNLEFLGEGQGGEVYLDKFKEQIIKILHQPIPIVAVKYLMKLSALKLIPQIYEISPTFIIQKYVKGKTLDKLLMKRISYSEALKLIDRIKTHIQDWHDLGYGHGDLTFENIIVTSKGKVVFIDPVLYGYSNQYIENDKDTLDFIRDEILGMAE